MMEYVAAFRPCLPRKSSKVFAEMLLQNNKHINIITDSCFMFMFLRFLRLFGGEEDFYVQFGISNDSEQIDFETFLFYLFSDTRTKRISAPHSEVNVGRYP